MAESRQKSPEAGTLARAVAPPPVLYGFLLLLVLMFAVSYAVGSAGGPVAPGMSGTGAGAGAGVTPAGGGGEVQDMGGMDEGAH